MSDQPIIVAEGIGKKYAIHHGGRKTYSSLRDSITQATKSLVLKSQEKEGEEEFWALKNIDFKIQKGEAVGIIGRNGAGKSTLLKILSRITEPSEGRIVAKGRVASLLEVGTGFHQELTGRENIFLNGAILGMSKNEIRRKFDEIVEFSGVEKFLDTPVKHYSSGMNVRLAFAVAAHLEQEILLVDEVLAVGDNEFQQKCLGKMGEVSREKGRTVLFVSHDLGSISQLCSKVMLLENGKLQEFGQTEEVINAYMRIQRTVSAYIAPKDQKGKFIRGMKLMNKEGLETYSYKHDEPMLIHFSIELDEWIPGLYLAYAIQNKFNKRICLDYVEIEKKQLTEHNDVNLKIEVPAGFLTPGSFSWDASLISPNIETYDSPFGICPFEIIDNNSRITRFSRADYGDVFISTTQHQPKEI
jgi:lipopolysaccharide transport system ATP-binding protein